MVDDKRLKYLESIYQDKCCITQNDKDIQSIIKELIEYRAIGTVEELKSLNHFVYDENLFEYKEFFELIEKALGIKLFAWQKYYIIHGYYRRSGLTYAQCIRTLTQDTIPLDLSHRPKSPREDYERCELRKIQERLKSAGIPTRTIFWNERQKRYWLSRSRSDE